MGFDIVHIKASGVMDYAMDNSDVLTKEEHIVAENAHYGTQICVSVDRTGSVGPVILKVYDRDERVVEARFLNPKKDCTDTVLNIYKKYLNDYDEDDETWIGNMTLAEAQDEIADREAEIDDVIYDLINVLAGEIDMDMSSDEFSDIADKIKEGVIRYIAEDCGITVYRPMIFEDEKTGDVFYEEYPYETVDF